MWLLCVVQLGRQFGFASFSRSRSVDEEQDRAHKIEAASSIL
jgi:hypothetical protein